MFSDNRRQTPGSLRAQHELQLQRRNMEEQRQITMNKRYSDIQKAEKDATSYQKLISDRTFKNSVDSYMKQQIEERKCSDMQFRRAELSALLHEEENQYKAELIDALKDANDQRVREMQERAEKLRQARTKQQEQLVAEKLHESWRRNCPELREAATKQIDMETAKAWGDQISLRQESEAEDRKMDAQMVENMKREVQLAEEKDREKKELEQSRMHDITDMWEQQISSLRKHEDQIRALQQQEREYLQQLSELARMEDQRRRLEDIEKRKDFGQQLVKQHAALVRRRNRQVQESIEFDRQLLESVQRMEQESMLKDQQKKENARSVAAQMKEMMENRLRTEREREREIDRLDREEAKLYWEKREQEWAAEEDARKNLVSEVIGDLRIQLQDKMAANRQAQEEVEKGREELSSMMRLTEMEKQKEVDTATRAQMNRRRDLDAQLSELELKEIRDRETVSWDNAKRVMERRSYDDFLARETAKMGVSTPLPGNRRCPSAASWASR